ncbi:AAA family ATPase [Pseudidiomarina sp. YC-516-91]|uniref:AAA family ATPase n=1 Tax=Pseudidiomarina salilacus TaxID=3384452 RepID=UPI0039854268
MYKIDRVDITGFWGRSKASASFNGDVNIIIGRNGTGKTTFMNILHSVLTVDIEGLAENEFDTVKVVLIDGKRRKTISVKRDALTNEFAKGVVSYQISNQKSKTVRLATSDDRRLTFSARRRLFEETEELKRELQSLIAISSLSVYRLRNDDEYEVRDRHGSRVVAPVDFRLEQALRALSHYQLELAEKAQQVSKKLQRSVLASVLYSEEDLNAKGWQIDFDRDEEQSKLVLAYGQLNSVDSEIRKKIRFHVEAIDNAVKSIREGKNSARTALDVKPLEALRKTRKIIDLSLDAENDNKEIYKPIDLFLKKLSDFISDKSFSFVSGRLAIENKHGLIDHKKMSSGEKQLIILLIEALLQKKAQHVFLTDEPELSLHIDWQRKIIPAVRDINPNAQVLVATHSPEVASYYSSSILDMEDLIHG